MGIQNESEPKRLKTNNSIRPNIEIKVNNETIKKNRCLICKQFEDQVLLYNGHPNASEEEFVALTDERLSLFTGEEADVDQRDERPTNKITLFNIYDKKGHLVPIDTGLIEQDVSLYASGYIKPIFDDDSSAENGIPTHGIGPINAWYISGYDGGDKVNVSFSTAYADYYMMAPSESFEPLMKTMYEKIKLAKIVVEFLVEESWAAPAYEDLLERLASYEDPNINEECLLRHAQFICDQIISLDQNLPDDPVDDSPFIALPCVRNLVKLAGVEFQKRTNIVKLDSTKATKECSKWSKATTTNLVREVMESYFTDQIDSHNDESNEEWGPKKKRCGVCEACQQADCGNCINCRAMLKFGGSGRTKQACKLRRCPNMAIQAAEDSDNDEESDMFLTTTFDPLGITLSKRIIHEVQWIGEPSSETENCYTKVKIGNIIISSGDYVVLNPSTQGHPFLVAKVVYIWEDIQQGPMFHALLFIRGSDTILGETSDPREIFLSDNCDNCPVGAIVRRASVECRFPPDNWELNGGQETLPKRLEDDGENFYFSKKYTHESARFEYFSYENCTETDKISRCCACTANAKKEEYMTPIYRDHSVTYQGKCYKVGSAVYLTPRIFKSSPTEGELELDESIKGDVDKRLYPEYYRKNVRTDIKDLNVDTTAPFCIGLIEEIIPQESCIKIKVRKFYRPENTHVHQMMNQHYDLNLIFYSDEDELVDFLEVQGKCFIMYSCNMEQLPEEWFKLGPNRFYFLQKYNSKTFTFEEVPATAMCIGLSGKGANNGKNKSTKVCTKSMEVAPMWEKIKPLRCLDVFAGCGGLSEGLHQSGVAKTYWAIEKDKAAAHAFQLNNRNTKVFTDDCNQLLKEVMDGNGRSKEMPAKGDVQLLVGGPPCQGFSGMNRFNAGQYSLFKNSLIVSFLSYCDYYRPNYFILENVRNFATFKKFLVLKLTLRCLLAMGYQATFGVVQAGHYGVPQTRRRLIIMAAAPGFQLPQYPEPLHVFSRRGGQLSIKVANHRYTNGTKWKDSAPFRTITVRDAMGDLPPIKNGVGMRSLPYANEANTHYQRLIRGSIHNTTVTDHICKIMIPLVEARMSHIPLAAGSDWRDLPNIVVRLKDGTYTKILRYEYRTKKQTLKEDPKGVCQCAMKGGVCDPSDRQFNTLIPWCLPHTGDRHNHWSGLYGRLEWNGYFSTTVTNPEPMGKQGRILHPEQHRVVSVRECARSQGFPDVYQFAGGILDKYRQIGNAVPPPLGAALGREIVKAHLSSVSKQKFVEVDINFIP